MDKNNDTAEKELVKKSKFDKNKPLQWNPFKKLYSDFGFKPTKKLRKFKKKK